MFPFFSGFVLTLPVSTAIMQDVFSAMKLVEKRWVHSGMEDKFLAYNLVIYIEKELAKSFTELIIMDEFYDLNNHH
jgi:hypothetical protein